MANIVSFGIYFGNSSCCVAVNRDGKIDVVANAAGDRVTPAVVGFHENEVVTGTSAKQALVRHASCSVVGALRAIGTTSEDELTFPLNLKCQLLYDTKRPKYAVQNGDKNKMITPEEVIKHLFSLLKEIASSHSSEDRIPVVIALPAWVTDSAIAVVHHSASAAGFQVLSTVTQPAAACLAYSLLDDNNLNFNVLVFHCGGTSTVAAVAEISGGLLTIKETSTSNISGDALTSVLVEHFAKEFFMKYRGNPLENRRSTRKLYTASENCKHVLSTMSTSQVNIESLWEGVDYSTPLSRARFDGIVSSTLNEFLVPVKEVLQRSSLSQDQISKVILTGGSCKIPKLQKVISDYFQNADVMKRCVSDETLAIGAAIESASCLNGKSNRIHNTNILLSCLSLPVYVKLLGNKISHCVFVKGTPTHARRSLSLECPTGPCSLYIYEGDNAGETLNEDKILSQINLNFRSSNVAHLQLDFTLKKYTHCEELLFFYYSPKYMFRALKYLSSFVLKMLMTAVNNPSSDGSLLVKLAEHSSKFYKSFSIEANKLND